MIRTAEGDNDRKLYTSFFCIQQVTKGGEFVGSNVIKHATTAMMEIRFDESNKSERYVEFTKNRRCGDAVFKKLYFTLDKKTGEIKYDSERFQSDAETIAKVNTEALRKAEDDEQFGKVFFGAEAAGEEMAG
jgi:predicted ATP-dependent serine protease